MCRDSSHKSAKRNKSAILLLRAKALKEKSNFLLFSSLLRNHEAAFPLYTTINFNTSSQYEIDTVYNNLRLKEGFLIGAVFCFDTNSVKMHAWIAKTRHLKKIQKMLSVQEFSCVCMKKFRALFSRQFDIFSTISPLQRKVTLILDFENFQNWTL